MRQVESQAISTVFFFKSSYESDHKLTMQEYKDFLKGDGSSLASPETVDGVSSEAMNSYKSANAKWNAVEDLELEISVSDPSEATIVRAFAGHRASGFESRSAAHSLRLALSYPAVIGCFDLVSSTPRAWRMRRSGWPPGRSTLAGQSRRPSRKKAAQRQQRRRRQTSP